MFRIFIGHMLKLHKMSLGVPVRCLNVSTLLLDDNIIPEIQRYATGGFTPEKTWHMLTTLPLDYHHK